MHIMVVLRLVPDTDEEFEIAEDGKDIDREWIGLKLNEFDDQALEEAILVKEAHGARVTALAFDGEGVDRLLQTALARGADAVIKVKHGFEGMMPAVTCASIVSQVIREHACDLVLTGVQAVDDLFGQLAPALGVALGWPQVSAVSGLKLSSNELLVGQEHSGGVVNILAVSLPAVIGIQSASHPIRYVSGSKLREFFTTKIPEVVVEVSSCTEKSRVSNVYFPVVADRAEMLSGSADQVARQLSKILRERGITK